MNDKKKEVMRKSYETIFLVVSLMCYIELVKLLIVKVSFLNILFFVISIFLYVFAYRLVVIVFVNFILKIENGFIENCNITAKFIDVFLFPLVIILILLITLVIILFIS